MTEAIDIETIGETQPLLEGLRTARAIRRLRPDPVPRELVRKVCEAGTFAPSGGNRQPWTFIAVMEADRRAWVAERYRKAFHTYIAPALKASKASDFPDATRRNIRAALYLADHLHEAPVHLFVCGPEQSAGTVYPAMQNALLACRGLGLASVITMFHRPHTDELQELLGIPEGQVAHGLLPIGWPSDRIGPVSRVPVHKVTSMDRWGDAWDYAKQQPDEGLRKRWTGR